MLACLTYAPATKQGKSSEKTIAFFRDDSVESNLANAASIVVSLAFTAA